MREDEVIELYVRTRAIGLHYAITYPNVEFQTGRNLRMSPIYPKLKEAGAVFGQVMGYERPNWFSPELMSGTMLVELLSR